MYVKRYFQIDILYGVQYCSMVAIAGWILVGVLGFIAFILWLDKEDQKRQRDYKKKRGY